MRTKKSFNLCFPLREKKGAIQVIMQPQGDHYWAINHHMRQGLPFSAIYGMGFAKHRHKKHKYLYYSAAWNKFVWITNINSWWDNFAPYATCECHGMRNFRSSLPIAWVVAICKLNFRPTRRPSKKKIMKKSWRIGEWYFFREILFSSRYRDLFNEQLIADKEFEIQQVYFWTFQLEDFCHQQSL